MRRGPRGEDEDHVAFVFVVKEMEIPFHSLLMRAEDDCTMYAHDHKDVGRMAGS